MATGTPAGGLRLRLVVLAGVLGCGVLGVGLAAVLAHPAAAPPSVLLRLLAQLAGVLVVGLCVVERLEDPRRRGAVRARVWPLLAVTATAWLVAELALLVVTAAEALRRPVLGVPAAEVLTYARVVSGGRVGVLDGACVLVVLGLSVVAVRSGGRLPLAPVPALAAVALLGRPLTGHLERGGVLLVASAAHVLAAAAWCGGLVGVAVVAGAARGAWARLLPRFSVLAVWCVGVLAVSGTVEAAYQVGGLGALTGTGYGRVVLGKAAVLAVLVGLGWWARRRWVPATIAQRGRATLSVRRAVVEVAVMAVALGLASALAVTG